MLKNTENKEEIFIISNKGDNTVPKDNEFVVRNILY